MNSEKTLLSIKNYCLTNSGNEQIWKNKDTTYQWTRGRDTENGMINGVVRKLAGVDINGNNIWVVAGSLKIKPDGFIDRFTGMPKKQQKLFTGITKIVTIAESKVLETA